MLTLVVYLRSLRRVVIPTTFMLGSSPGLFGCWWIWRASTCLLPTRLYEYGDQCIWSVYQRLILFFFENYVKTEVFLYEDALDVASQKENVLYISNHQCEVDWIAADMLAIRQGSLGNIRYILKSGLKYLPMFGFYFRQHGCVYVTKGKFSDVLVARQLAQLAKNRTNIWMVVFPEGTRYAPENVEKIERSQQFANDRGYPELHQVLSPRYRATQLCIDQLYDHLDAVYDVTIAYSGTTNEDGSRCNTPGMTDFLLQDKPEVHFHVRRFDINAVPRDADKLKSWLHGRFKEKDRLLAGFYSSDHNKRGHFEGSCQKSQLRIRQTLPAALLFAGMNVIAMTTECGWTIYWMSAAYGSLVGLVWMTLKA